MSIVAAPLQLPRERSVTSRRSGIPALPGHPDRLMDDGSELVSWLVA
jgi:hypothetical protein